MAILIGLLVLVLLGVGFAVLRIQLEGPPLGDKLASLLNKRMRGRIEIGSVEWPVSALRAAVTGGWVPVTIHDVKVWDDCALGDQDPETIRLGDPHEDCTPDDKPDPTPGSKRKPRKLLISTPLVTAEIDIHAVMFGNHDLVFRNVHLHGGEALIEQTREPYPLHAYNRTIVSIVSAFYPRMKAGFRAGIYADSAPPTFDLRDVHVDNLNVTVHVAPWTNKDGTVGFGLTARVEGVDIDAGPTPRRDAYLYDDPRDPLANKFYVRFGLRGKQGAVRIMDEGPRAAFRIPRAGETWGAGRHARYAVAVTDVDIARLAQLPTEWPRKDYVANSLELDATLHAVPCVHPGEPPPARDAGADIHVTGGLIDYFDRPYDGQWNFDLDATNLGPVVRSCIKSTIGGDNLGGRVSLRGPFVAPPRVDLDLHDLDFDVPLSAKEAPVRLTLAKVSGWIDLVNEVGAIDQTTALVRGGKDPGELMVAARFGLRPLQMQADVDIVKPIDVGRFLPGRIANSVGRFLSGKLSVRGDVELGFELTNFDVALGSTPRERAVRVFSGRVFERDKFAWIELQRIRFEGGLSHATITGAIQEVGDEYVYRNLTIEGEYPDLDKWLERFGLPPIAKSAGGGTITLNGPITSPTIDASTTLAGIPCIDTMKIERATIKDKIADIKMSTVGLGGAVTGDGRIDLGATPPVIERLHLDGNRLDASKLCGLGRTVKGTIDTASIDLKGSIDPKRPAADWAALAKVYATAKHVAVYGDSYSNIALCINRPDSDDAKLCRPEGRSRVEREDIAACGEAKRGGFCAVATARRDRGGTLEATIANLPAARVGRAVVPGHLGGAIVLDDIPMAVLDPLVGPGTVGGLFSAVLHLEGKLSPLAPQAHGAIDLLRGWVGNAFTGDSHLEVDPILLGTTPGLLVRGEAMSKQMQISATIGTAAPFPVDVSISGRRIEVDQFVDLAKKLGLPEPVQAWASGTITLHTELAPLGGKPAPTEAWVEVTELEAIVDHRSRDGRQTPLRFALVPIDQAHYAMSVRITPSTIELACRKPSAPGGREPCPATLETPAGLVSIAGNATQTAMSLHATGDLDLKKLAPLLENQLDDISGVLTLDGHVTGTFDKPSYDVELTAKDPVSIQPTGSDNRLVVARDSEVKLQNGNLGFNSFTVAVNDERKGELHVKGAIGMDGLVPARWGVLIDGVIAGKMLQLLLPNALSQAGGSARIDGDLELSGHGKLPLVNGTIVFDPLPAEGGLPQSAPLAISPRAVRREVALVGGSIDISTSDDGAHRTYTVATRDDGALTATIDGEGKLEHIAGGAVFRDGVPEEATIDLDAENVPFHNSDRTLDLSFAAKDVELAFKNGFWRASGNIAIVSGTYKRNFELTDAIKPAPPTVAPAKPFWDEYPSIGGAELDLTLEVRRFAVANNIAQIELEGPTISITGSPRNPQLSGSITVQRGEFTIPLTRAKFTRTTGSIDFAANDRASNPHLEITSDAPDYHDLSGQQHIITMTISGTLEQPQWDLKTNTGLDKSQTLSLLLLGRSPDQLRRSLGDQSLGSNPTSVDPTTNPSTGFADEVVKDLAGDWVSSLLGNSLTRLTHLDVLRFELGFGSVGVHAEYKALENLKLIADGEETIRGNTVQLSLELRLPWHFLKALTNDRFSLQGAYLQKQYSDPADQALDIQDLQGKAVYRLFIP
ncbi:MAG TPA: translocation/assembly module TamB domain-containing protein [Kofleriaceae bacterium]|nr:translocation/assembly module TamB domain-containing protein [Kofleriaceae bacterium]